MSQLLNALKGKKTYLAVAAMLVNIWFAYDNGTLSKQQAADEAIQALAIAFVRHGIASSNTPLSGGQKPPTP